MNTKCKGYGRRLTALLLALVMLCSLFAVPAFAAQEDNYHDPAEHWLNAANRTNELDANAVVTHETFPCAVCGTTRSFTVWRTPEYARDGQTARTRNVLYSDGTTLDGKGKGTILDGTPGADATYTGYHWTKACCDTCGTINSNMGINDYSCGKNVYWLYDCLADYMEDLEPTAVYEYADAVYHRVTRTTGQYCCFCFGTRKTVSTTLERHNIETEVLPQPANGRFATVEHCADCGYSHYAYTAAKAVVADYYGVADGQPHTIMVTDLSESGVSTRIRYGSSAGACTLATAPNYTAEGQYTVYYEITYTFQGKTMTENGAAYVWLRDESVKADGSCGCGCGEPNCGCQDKDCNGDCCKDKGCGENHRFVLLDSVNPGCLTLGYDRYLCTECGKIEKRDYEAALGHSFQSVLIREADCETDGKLLEICARCGQMNTTATPKGEHKYSTHDEAATCTSPGYTVMECSVCGDRRITNITPALPHNYKAHVTPPTCVTGGHTVHQCEGCGSSFVSDYTDPAGHKSGDWIVDREPTADSEGERHRECQDCGEKHEAAAIFARILAARKGDSITPSAATMFADIPAGVWYSGYVNYLSGYGIVNGRGNNIFAPDAPVTRAEFTAMAVRFFAVYGDGNAEIMEQYKDFNDVTPGYWASQYIEDAARHGWVLGYGNGSFGPENNITRSEVVTLVNRLLDRDADLSFIKANLRTLVTFPDVKEGAWYYGAVMEAANNHTAKMGDAETWSR